MALADLLGAMGGGGMPLPNYSAGINQSFADNRALGASQIPPQAAPHGPSGFRSFLGAIGDALLVSQGHEPAYRKAMEQQQQQNALKGFLTNPDDAIRLLMQTDAKSGIELYRAVHPASETPDTAKIYEYRQKLDPAERPDFDKVMASLHPGMFAPVSMGPSDTIEQPGTGGGSSGPPQSAVEYLKSHPALAPHFDEKYGPGAAAKVMGGQTAHPSGGFSVNPSHNNNPGALRFPGSMKFQSFDTPQAGVQAQEAQLGRYFKRGINSVSGVVETYAPRKSRGGDNTDEQVNNYIGYVSKRLGIDPSAPLSSGHLSRLAQAMREFETGQRAN